MNAFARKISSVAFTMIVTVVCCAQTETVLHDVSLTRGGSQPVAGLVLDWSGTLYGTVEQGGDRSSKGKSTTNWSSLPLDAQRAIVAALEQDDPGWTQQAELTASDGQAQDGFGYSVAVSGSTVVVGAPTHPYLPPNQGPGAVYVFVESGGTWSQQAELTASDGVSGDLFGDSIAVDGNTIVVGAPRHRLGSNLYPGAAYVFVESGGTWSQQAELTASDGASWDFFGNSVAIRGPTAVVGAVYHEASGLNEPGPGAAYVFVENGGTWSQQAELTPSDGFDDDLFGTSVAVSGSTVFVGAPRHTVGTNVDQGVAYVFAENGGIWTHQAELTPADGVEYGGFGGSLALDGGTAVLGDASTVYVFEESGGVWIQQAELTPSVGTANTGFGGSLALSGSTVAAGAANQNVGSNPAQGAAYLFAQSGGMWGQQAELTASDGAQINLFGTSVGLSGGVAVVGAPGREVGANAGQGAAYVFVSPTVTLSPTPMSFGNQAVSTTSASKTVTLKNTGTTTLYNSSIAITAGNIFFAISNNTCGATLAAGKTCKVSVTFTPTQLAAEAGTLTFTDNASGSPETVSLTGTGVAQATLAPSAHTFPKTKVGSTSAPYNFTLKNNLNTTLTGISYSTAAPFAVSASTCTTTLDSKKTCTISVTFSPTVTGTATGTLTVNDGANDSPQTASLSGAGD